MSSRQSILIAARELFITRGYEATSPRDIMDLAKAGQGSFYHHFRTKAQLGREVLNAVSEDLLGVGRGQLVREGSPTDRLRGYLYAERDALRGCRLGRFAYDVGLDEANLREPTSRYFKEMERLLIGVFTEIARGSAVHDAACLSASTLAIVQGGYVLARIHGDPAYLTRAVDGLWSLVNATFPAR